MKIKGKYYKIITLEKHGKDFDGNRKEEILASSLWLNNRYNL
jgi:hypothetical protein